MLRSIGTGGEKSTRTLDGGASRCGRRDGYVKCHVARLAQRLRTLVLPSLMVIDEIGYLPITRTGPCSSSR